MVPLSVGHTAMVCAIWTVSRDRTGACAVDGLLEGALSVVTVEEGARREVGSDRFFTPFSPLLRVIVGP
jgi:hypothetical protein